MVKELKERFEEKKRELELMVRKTDPVFKFLKEDHIGDFRFQTGLRMLPLELVEKFGSVILQDKNEYDKNYDLKYDVYLVEWEKHLEGYWKDKIMLVDAYHNPAESGKTPLEVYNKLSDLMIKIERRSLLLKPDPMEVEQKHTRSSGAKKDYIFLRNYWVDDDGEKKRMISKHVGMKYLNLEQEVMDMFHHRGFGVIRDYRSDKGFSYDVVIQRGDMKTVLEIKLVNKDVFKKLFMFDELLKKFKQDYPNG